MSQKKTEEENFFLGNNRKMGRSPSFCFKIKACAGESTDNDGVSPPPPPPLPENKESPRKHRWSFGRRSTNNVSSNMETLVSMSIFHGKQNQEAASDSFSLEKAPSALEKASFVEQIVQSPLLSSAVVSSSISEDVTENAIDKADQNIPEHVVIQTSIRSFLAQREIKRLVHVIKLQAVARGYFVRRQAAGTLRCIQAIIKMQVLVRSHLAAQSAKLTLTKNSEDHISSNLVKQSNKKLNKKASASSNLACNAFARRLLESTPRTNPIQISCDRSRPDSAWNWLERWMALTSKDQKMLFLNQDVLRKDTEDHPDAYDVGIGVHVTHEKTLPDLPAHDDDDKLQSKVVESLIVEKDKVSGKLGLQENSGSILGQMQFSSDAYSNSELAGNPNIVDALVVEKDKLMTRTASEEITYNVPGQMPLSSDVVSHSELSGDSTKLSCAEDVSEDCFRKELQETPDIEGDEVLNGSRKSKNPAFVAVQAKFEELSSASCLSNYFSNASKDARSESKSAESLVGSNFKEVSEIKSGYSKVDDELKEVGLHELLTSHNQKDPPENVAEISISSTFHGSEADMAKIVPDVREPEETKHDMISGVHVEEMKCETKGHSSELDAIQIETAAASRKSSSVLTAAAKQTEEEQQPAESTSSTMMKSLPCTLSRREKSQPEIKISPANSKNDSDARNSVEYLRKDVRHSKRQNSAGTTKVDRDDHEIKSSSISSLPSYMQPTESAKAKVNPCVSQKSRPDLHDKGNHLKKRHSLPTGDGKHGSSPRMQWSISQAQHN
ncbi:Protein IQ-domain 32 [Apostasia shenzhenica]|uniref:Protein IQ-domain 32 n=1 Tax=Apostasia shenzhenica TaxID=1088818 RepID=A0A2I0AC29_9ASPA|nr:Protein IQ-domain 32 [Apostasia shenzhenica]